MGAADAAMKSAEAAFEGSGAGEGTKPILLNPTSYLRLNVGVTSHAEIFEIEGLFTQGSRPGRTFGKSVGEILEPQCWLVEWHSIPYVPYQFRH